MSFHTDLCNVIEAEEHRSVGTSFGGIGGSAIFSVRSIRDWVTSNYMKVENRGDAVTEKLYALYLATTPRLFNDILANSIRYSFLIELTDLKVGSTKMKTRWVPGLILMPQPNSFEPYRGTFQPENDPRSSSFEECYNVFERVVDLTLQKIEQNEHTISLLERLTRQSRVPYEYLVGYRNPGTQPVHTAENIFWIENEDIRWLLNARTILHQYIGEYANAIARIEGKKLEVKVYKTDRALTGKDKTNRAKRWEVLFGDFQFASLQDCWSVERRLTEELIFFQNFPQEVKERFTAANLVDVRHDVTRCPITLAPLDFIPFSSAMVNAAHGRSDYQIGHLTPLKRGGRHIGPNIAWQSADGNRIQGDLTLEETVSLLGSIAGRRASLT